MRAQSSRTQEGEIGERRAHHPCPACGALVMAPERVDHSRGFVCPSCKVHLWDGQDHLHLVWNHHEIPRGPVEGAPS